MNYDAFQIYSRQASAELTKFSNSTTFYVIKFLLGIYAIVIIADIVLLLVKRGMGGNIRESIVGMNVPRELTTKKKKMRIQWNRIKNCLKSNNESEYKVAIIEADNIIDELISRMSYPGENLGERLNNIPEGQIESLEKLKQAHEIRNRIIHQENFQVNREDTKDVLKKYESFLEEFEVV